MTTERRFEIIKWMNAENSRIAEAQERAGERGIKHRNERDCKVAVTHRMKCKIEIKERISRGNKMSKKQYKTKHGLEGKKEN